MQRGFDAVVGRFRTTRARLQYLCNMRALSFRLCLFVTAVSLLSVPSTAFATSPPSAHLSAADARILRQIAPTLPAPAHGVRSVAAVGSTGTLPAVWSTVSSSARRGLGLLAVLVVVVTTLALAAAARRPVPTR
jgi:hypothetical protein